MEECKSNDVCGLNVPDESGFELSENVKKKLMNILGSERAVLRVENLCNQYKYECEMFSEKPRPKVDRQVLGDMIEELQKILDANNKIFHLLNKTWGNLPDLIHFEYVNQYILEHSCYPEERRGDLIMSMMEMFERESGYVDSIKALFLNVSERPLLKKGSRLKREPDYMLVKELLLIYEEETGKRVRRSYNAFKDDKKSGETSPLVNIMDILDPVLNRGQLTGVIRNILDERKKKYMP